MVLKENNRVYTDSLSLTYLDEKHRENLRREWLVFDGVINRLEWYIDFHRDRGDYPDFDSKVMCNQNNCNKIQWFYKYRKGIRLTRGRHCLPKTHGE